MRSCVTSWPRQRQRAPGPLIDVGSDPSRLEISRPYQRTDLRAGGAVVEPLGGQRMAQRMAQPMRTRARGTAPGPCQRAAHARPDRLALGNAPARRPPPDQDPPCRAGRSPVTAIGDEGCADLVGQGEAIRARALAPAEACPRVPSQIIQGEGRHFTSPYAPPGQPAQHRGLALPCWCRPSTALQEGLDGLGFPKLGPG